MAITFQLVVFDAVDLAAESAFWAGVLGGTVDASDDDWHEISVDGRPCVAVQLAPGHVAPDWPDGTPEQQVHVDLWTDDIAAAHAQVTGLGARLLERPEDHPGAPDNFQVYADPEGHPFCLCWA